MSRVIENRGSVEMPAVNGLVIKTCGIMTAEHAVAAAEGGAHMIGMIFARSRRNVSIETAQSIRAALDALPSRPLLVGVFVNEMHNTIRSTAEAVRLDIVQLSGDETPSEVADCADHFPVLKALRFPAGTSFESALDEFKSYRLLVPGERLRFVVDTYHPGEYGGTGRLADWGIAAELARREEIMLAGGLTPDNVVQAAREVAPWGVDVSSGIERDGQKDHELIEAFIANARHARTH
ncbi:MAG: phosphoribosylanthranilate isomerase [Chloroflexota bacterium]